MSFRSERCTMPTNELAKLALVVCAEIRV